MVIGESETEFYGRHQSLAVAIIPDGVAPRESSFGQMTKDDDKHAAMLTASSKHLIRREKHHQGQGTTFYPNDGDVTISRSKDATVKEHMQVNSTPSLVSGFGSSDVGNAGVSPEENDWQVLSSGDAQALTIHDGMIYIVAQEEKLYLLEKGIYAQPLNGMTPYSNWTLIGWGSMISIAVQGTSQGKIMYGVGVDHWLYRQSLGTMRENNVWELASLFPLSAIAIYGNTTYGISPAHPSEVFKLDCNVFGHPNGKFHGWFPVTTGPIKTFSIFGDSIFAIMENHKIYNKSLAMHHVISANVSSNASEMQTFEDFWTLKNNANMLSIAVVGDTIYGVSQAHKVCRVPVIVNRNWAPVAAGPMRSLAINANGDTIYGAGEDGNVYKQDLLTMSVGSAWVQVGSPDVSSIAIQGGTIYGVGSDKRVYKQLLESLTLDTPWERSSACCVLQLTIADGIIYAVGDDQKIYSQNDILMTPQSQWVLVSDGPWKLITTREDSMYGIDPDGITHIQSLSYLTPRKQWSRTSIEEDDQKYPSKAYTCITAHNDIMYACGPDMVVYSRLIDRYISYPPRLRAHGNTYEQAFNWNLTDLRKSPAWGTAGAETTPLPRETTTLSREVKELDTGADNPATSTDAPIYQAGQEPGLSKAYIDTYRDKNSSAVYDKAWRGGQLNVIALLASSLGSLLRF